MAVSWVLVVSYLLIQAVIASHSLHLYIHPDADKAEHRCAATLLSKGLIEVTPAMVAIASPTFIETEAPFLLSPSFPAFNPEIQCERGPPSLAA